MDQLIMCGINKEETWAVYDVFRLFSKGFQFKIDRSSFCKGLKSCVTLKQLNVVKKARLRERFRESAQDVTLEEFLRMYWPKTTEDSMSSLIRWCHLREAQVVLDGTEAGEESVLRTIFDLLDINGDGRVSVEELHHAEILTSEQTTKLFNLVRRRYERLGAKALAAAALFGKVIDDCDFGQIFSSGGVKWDEMLSYQDFRVVIKARQNLDQVR
jgi:Ca2+-binding EF-hand superfamily protein